MGAAAGRFDALAACAHRVRGNILRMATGGGCFVGASLSCTDLLVYLHHRVLRVTPQAPDDPGRNYPGEPDA